MRIAIITSGFLPVIDGVTVSGLARVKKLSEWGHQVLLFCPDYSKLEHFYPEWRDYTGEILPGVRVCNLPSTPFFVEFERNVAFTSYPKLLQELEAFKPDVIHVDEPERLFMGFLKVPGVKFARQHNIPCFGFFRTNFLQYGEDFLPLPGPLLNLCKWLFKTMVLRVYNSYNFTLVSSTITHQELIKLGIKNTKYANLLGFDHDRYTPNLRQPNFWQDQFNLDLADKVKLIFVGRLTPDKGWDFTIKALTDLARRFDLNQLALIVVGDGELKSTIAAELEPHCNAVQCLGRIPPELMPALYANSDIHVTTSEKETRGLTILEAFASGITVLAPKAGGVVENIDHGVNGLLYQPQNIQDFQDKLLQLITDPVTRSDLGARGIQGMDRYHWDTTVQNLVHLWQSEINAPAPRP